MNEFSNEQTATEHTQAAGAEERTGESVQAVSYGKFRNGEALLNAYNNLQAEFTKRCQRLKELETCIKANAGAADNPQAADPCADGARLAEKVSEGITGEEKEFILKGYLKDLMEQKTGAIIMDGAGMGLKTPVSRPKTVEEAGRLFRGSLN